MILVVDTLNHDQFSDVLDEAYQLQPRLFGPDTKARFDSHGARVAGPTDARSHIYLVGLDSDGRVATVAKFPQMAGQIPAKASPESPPVSGIAQAVQFYVDSPRLSAKSSARLKATAMLMVGVLEYAQKVGIATTTAVIDPYISRILRQSSASPHEDQAKAGARGRVTAMATVLHCTADRIAALRAYAGIVGDIFLSNAAARALRDVWAKSKSDIFAPALLQSEIAQYCAQQLAAARTDKERAAAYRLLHHLVEKGLHPVPQKDPVTPQ